MVVLRAHFWLVLRDHACVLNGHIKCQRLHNKHFTLVLSLWAPTKMLSLKAAIKSDGTKKAT